MFFNKKKKQAQLEQEQKVREENAARLKSKIEMGKLFIDRCSDYKFEVEHYELKEVLAAFPAEEYELKIEEHSNYTGLRHTHYYIVKKKGTYYDARTHTYKQYEKENN